MDPLELSLRLPGSPPPPPPPPDVVEVIDVDDDNENEYVPDEDDDEIDDDDTDEDDNDEDGEDDDDDEDDDEEDGEDDDVISSPAASQQAGSSRGEQRMSSMEDYLDRMFNVDNRYQNQRRTVREQPPIIDHHLNVVGTNSSMASSSRGEQGRNSMEDYLDGMFNVDNRYRNHQRRTVREQPPHRNPDPRRSARQEPPLSNLNQSRTEQPPVIGCQLNMEGTSSSMSEPAAQSVPPVGAMSVFKCPICMEPLAEETVTKCGHIFCGPCIRAAIAAKHNNCPLCRCKITLSGLVRIYMPNSN